ELLMRCLHADEVSGIAEVIAMDAHGSRLRGNREIVSQTVLLMIVPRSESKQVMRNGHVSRVLIGGAVRDFVKELSHSYSGTMRRAAARNQKEPSPCPLPS